MGYESGDHECCGWGGVRCAAPESDQYEPGNEHTLRALACGVFRWYKRVWIRRCKNNPGYLIQYPKETKSAYITVWLDNKKISF